MSVINSRFDYVKYDDHSQMVQEAHKFRVEQFERLINQTVGCPRSKENALTALEECYMWIGKGIRNDQINRNGSAELQEERKDG